MSESRTQPPTTQQLSPARSKQCISSSTCGGGLTAGFIIEYPLKFQQVAVRVAEEEGIDRKTLVALRLTQRRHFQCGEAAVLPVHLVLVCTV